MSQTPGRLVLGVIVAVACMTASGAFLWLAQRDIPIGTATRSGPGLARREPYMVGIAFHGDSASAWRLVSVWLIVAEIIGLKLAHDPG